jgi:flagellin-specific chaperone FliS
MAIRQENPQKESCWLNELESLAVSAEVKNELNNTQETSNLTKNVKHAYFQAYKDAYSDDSLTTLLRRYEYS